jgi:ferrous iron transport protein A
MSVVCLTRLKTRQKIRVERVEAGASVQHRLLSMGIYPGRELVVLSAGALRGPVTVRVGRSTVALGHGMASKIMVETE